MTADAKYRELLIGCGHRRQKVVPAPDRAGPWVNLVTLDHNKDCGPDILCNLDTINMWQSEDFSGDDNFVLNGRLRADMWDEVHAYEVLEHLGQQGDVVSFFRHFEELYRILKPGGYLCATVPSRFSAWLWGDPGHRRVILPESLVFLSQPQYARQCGVTPMSDYRPLYSGDFDVVTSIDDRTLHTFILRAVKPARLTRAQK